MKILVFLVFKRNTLGNEVSFEDLNEKFADWNVNFEEPSVDPESSILTGSVYSSQVGAIESALEIIKKSYIEEFDPNYDSQETLKIGITEENGYGGFISPYDVNDGIYKINVQTTDYVGFEDYKLTSGNDLTRRIIHEWVHALYGPETRLTPEVLFSARFSEVLEREKLIDLGSVTTVVDEDCNSEVTCFRMSSLFDEIATDLIAQNLIDDYLGDGNFEVSDLKGSYVNLINDFVTSLEEHLSVDINLESLTAMMGEAMAHEKAFIEKFSENFENGVSIQGEEFAGYGVDNKEVENFMREYLRRNDELSFKFS